MSHKLIEIPQSEWPQLRALYEQNRLVSCSYNMLQFFITTVKHNEYMNPHIYSLDGDWQKDGLFIAVICGDCILFNSLADNTTRLYIALTCLDQKILLRFFEYRIRFQSTVLSLFTAHNLNHKDYDHNTIYWHHVSREIVNQWDIKPPTGYSIGEVNEEHAKFINDVWPHKYEGSENLVKSLINCYCNVGAYDEHGKLVAWCLIFPIGSLGMLQVLPEHQRKGLAAVVVKALSKKLIAQNYDVCSTVLPDNEASLKLFKKLGFKIIEECCWQDRPALV